MYSESDSCVFKPYKQQELSCLESAWGFALMLPLLFLEIRRRTEEAAFQEQNRGGSPQSGEGMEISLPLYSLQGLAWG